MSSIPNSNCFGEQLRILRVSAGISITELSSQVGVSKGYVSKLEKCKSRPSSAMVDKLAKAIGIDPGPLHILAGSLPSDVKQILYEHPRESHSFLREAFAAYVADKKKSNKSTKETIEFKPIDEVKHLYEIVRADCFEWMRIRSADSIHAT